jgi:hypothetical protein
MERRKAITTAAAASLTLLAGAIGITVNSGIVSGGSDDNVGQISPVDITNPPITVYVDEPVTTAPVTPPPPFQPTTSLVTSAAGDYHDDRDEHDDDHGDEYEGAEDDD